MNSLKQYNISSKKGVDVMIEKINKYRKELFGISAIAIVLFHIGNYTKLLPSDYFIGKLISLVFCAGNSGVDIFVLLSAIGLTYSFKKNTLTTFYLNRVKRTYIPYLVFALLFFIWYDFIALKDGIVQYILNILSINYFFVGPVFPFWFIPFIMIMYMLFPLIYKINKKSKYITILISFSIIIIEFLLCISKSNLYTNYETMISRIPIFLFGVLIADSKIRFSKKYNLLLFPLGFISFLLKNLLSFPEMICKYLLFIFALSIVVLYITIRESYKISFLKNINCFFGKYSLEIYISHVLFIKIIKFYSLWLSIPSPLWYLIIPVVSILISIIVSKLVNFFLKKFFNVATIIK